MGEFKAEACPRCGGLTRKFWWYALQPTYQDAMHWMIRRHRMKCLRIPRVSRDGVDGMDGRAWRVEFPTGYVWCDSFERAVGIALDVGSG